MKKILILIALAGLTGCNGGNSATSLPSVVGEWTVSENTCTAVGINYTSEVTTYRSDNTGTDFISDADCAVTDVFEWSGDASEITITNRVRSCSVESCTLTTAAAGTFTCTSGALTTPSDTGEPVDIGVTKFYTVKSFTETTYTISGTARDGTLESNPIVGECAITHTKI